MPIANVHQSNGQPFESRIDIGRRDDLALGRVNNADI